MPRWENAGVFITCCLVALLIVVLYLITPVSSHL